jgi:hypothetical protein
MFNDPALNLYHGVSQRSRLSYTTYLYENHDPSYHKYNFKDHIIYTNDLSVEQSGSLFYFLK